MKKLILAVIVYLMMAFVAMELGPAHPNIGLILLALGVGIALFHLFKEIEKNGEIANDQ